jgi:uncharacterized ferritin-like protein (DUF455 family)
MSAYSLVCQALTCANIDHKLQQVAALPQALNADGLIHSEQGNICRQTPAGVQRVPPQELARRSTSGTPRLAALFHAVAHIEYVAIDLALDHAARFAGMPSEYYADWIQVAADEAGHFVLVRDHLRRLGYDYGDFPVHDGLWEMAERTAHDVMARMALVPRLMEARGLDATPPMQQKLRQIGDVDGMAVLDVILADEVYHVALGDKWFRHLCTQRGLKVETTYLTLIEQLQAPWPVPPLNRAARLAAGFGEAELDRLEQPAPPGWERA